MADRQLEQRAQSRLGTVLRDKYRLDEIIGIGGMAVVYRATHRNQAKLAIKMLHPELSLNADVRARFLREGYAANTVNHPAAVLVVDDDIAEDGAAFLVMELLDGLPCDAIWSRRAGRLPVDWVCAIALELLDLLAAAHANGIIHRDIKPANLFVTRDGRLKVLDFGIARVRDTTGGALATGTGTVLGTPAFMSPEQVVGTASDVDARADLWGVGATMFTLVSGETVHDAETGPQFFVKVATQPVRSLGDVVRGAPPAITRVVDRALVLDKGQRWPSAAAMRGELASAARSVFGEIEPRELMASLLASPSGGPFAGAAESSPRQVTMTVARTGTPPEQPRVAVAVETSKPVSRDEARPATRPVPIAAWAFVALGVLVSIGGAAVGLHHRWMPKPKSLATSAPISPPPVDSLSTAPALPRAVDAPSAAASSEDAPVVLAPTTPEVPVPPAVSVPQAPLDVLHGGPFPPARHANSGAHASAASPVAAASAPPAPSAKPNCNPNYVLDENNQKHFKRECFQ